MYCFVNITLNYVIHYNILLASKSTILKILYYMFIEFIINALHIVEIFPNGLQIRHSLALLFFMLEYHANRLIAEKLFNSE